MIIINILNKHHGNPKGEYIGRGSPLGNPYPITKQDSRDFVCDAYEDWLRRKIQSNDKLVINELNRLANIALEGPLDLICFCSPKRCHGLTIKRIIMEAINGLDRRSST